MLALSTYHPEVLSQNPTVFDKMQHIWLSAPLTTRLSQSSTNVPVTRANEPKALINVLVAYARIKPTNIEVLFQLLSIFSMRPLIETSFLKQFLFSDIALFKLAPFEEVF